ncbi:MAG TPA: PQQ-binding-like beta-propeller repeat protein, partial [Cryomorphaceae bacterium]|nr:PQQ-binding-like beta-propeller repeat protein [Cryomorphaceae bacterium]
MKKTFLFLICASMILFQFCNKDDHESTPDPTPPSGLTKTISGLIFSQGGNPLSGAEVRINGVQTTSDSEGIFRIKDAPLSDGINYLRVSKAGYFDNGKSFHPAQGGEMSLSVTLNPRQLAGTINAGAGGEVTDGDGLKVTLNPNSIADGYQGEVRIYTNYVDPTTVEGFLEIPGLQAVSAANESGVLRSFGMGQIELEDANGNPLNMAAGATAELSIPVPVSLTGIAEPTIPLWFFDEDQGLWIEEGQASLSGNAYVGEVAHFTWWNADLFECGYVQSIKLTCGGEPLANVTVKFQYEGMTVPAGIATTNSEGYVSQAVPCNEAMEIFAIDPGISQESLSIGVFETGSTQEPLIDLSDICPPYTTVEGSAVNGQGNAVTNGYVYLRIGSYQTAPVFFDAQGAFEISAYDLSGNAESAQIVAWDLENFITVDGPEIPLNNASNVLAQPIIIAGETAQPEGLIYVGCDNDVFYCLDAETGEEVWSYQTGGEVRGGASLYYDNKVYFGSRDGNFYCLNAADGSVIWSKDVGNSSTGFNAPIESEGVIYFSSNSSDGLHAVNAETGDLLWFFNAMGDVGSSPVAGPDVVYSGQSSGAMRAIDKDSGNEVWEYAAGSSIGSHPCL